jgi:hypothetical protein
MGKEMLKLAQDADVAIAKAKNPIYPVRPGKMEFSLRYSMADMA